MAEPKKIPYEKRQSEEPPPSFLAGVLSVLRKGYPQADLSEQHVAALQPFLTSVWRKGYRSDEAAAATFSHDGALSPTPAALVGQWPKYRAPKGAQRGQVFGAGALRLPVAADRALRALQYQEAHVGRELERAQKLAERGNAAASQAAHTKAQKLREVSLHLHGQLLDEAHKLGVIAPADRPPEAVPPAPAPTPKPAKVKKEKPAKAEKPPKPAKAEKPVKTKAEKTTAKKPKAEKPKGVQVTEKGTLRLDGKTLSNAAAQTFLKERFPDRFIADNLLQGLWWQKAIDRYWPLPKEKKPAAPKDKKPAKGKAAKPAAQASESIPGCPSEHRWRLADHMLCWVADERRYADLNFELLSIILRNDHDGPGVPISTWQQKLARIEYFEADRAQAEHLEMELGKEYPGVLVHLTSRPRATTGKPGERARQVLQPGLVVTTPTGDLRIDRVDWRTQTDGSVYANGSEQGQDALSLLGSIDRGESQILPLAPEIPRAMPAPAAPPASKKKKTAAPKPAPAATPAVAAPAMKATRKGKKMPKEAAPAATPPAAPAPGDDAEIGALVDQGMDRLIAQLQKQAQGATPPAGT